MKPLKPLTRWAVLAVLAIFQCSCEDPGLRGAKIIHPYLFDKKSNLLTTENIDIITPAGLKAIKHGFSANGYYVDFDNRTIMNVTGYANAMFDSQGFSRGLETNFNKDDYIAYSKEIDRTRGVVTIKRTVPLLDRDYKPLRAIVKVLWETSETFEHPGADGGEEVWLRDGADMKRFVTVGVFYDKEPPRILIDTVKLVFERNIGTKE